MTPLVRRLTVRLCAAVAIVVCWAVVSPPAFSSTDRDALASRYAFDRAPMSPADPYGARLRDVAPAYRSIRSWISSVGAGVGLGDLDGNGRADDSCLVDPRDDTVTIAPVPGTGTRFVPARLDPAPALPYDATMAPMGCLPADVNTDGLLDVLVYYWGRSPVIFLRTTAPGMRFVAREAVEPYQIWNTDAVTTADVDGDGHPDLIVGNYFRDGAKVLDPNDRTDANLQMQDSMSRAYNGGTDKILLFTGATAGAAPTVRFTAAEGAFPENVAGAWTLAAAAQDLTGDGLPEIYFGNDFGPDRLLLNRSTPGHPLFTTVNGRRGLTTPKSKALGNDSFKGMGVSFTDLDADAEPDIVVSNITEPWALQESNFAFVSGGRAAVDGSGGTGYTDRSTDLGLAWSGWSWDVKTPDLDGDGVPEALQATGFVRGSVNRWAQLQELAMANDELLRRPGVWPVVRPGDDLSGHDPDRFFARGDDGRYHDVAAALGVADRNPSRGIAVADVDHDGRLDFAVAHQWAQSSFFRNTGRLAGGFLGLRLRQPVGCTAAAHTGARTAALGASVVLDRPAGGVRIGQVFPANGHDGVSSDELYFGLPHDPSVTATVGWRDLCGARHAARIGLAAGWHTLLLTPSGTVQEVRS